MGTGSENRVGTGSELRTKCNHFTSRSGGRPSLWHGSSHQSFCKQLCSVLCRKLQCFWLFPTAFTKREVELCSLSFSNRADAANVSIRPLAKRKEAFNFCSKISDAKFVFISFIPYSLLKRTIFYKYRRLRGEEQRL